MSMKVLWIANILFPEAQAILSGNGELKSSGGWMVAAAEELVKQQNVCLAIATVTPCVSEFRCLKGKKIVYYLIPVQKSVKQYERYCNIIRGDFNPVVTHIHGTENPYGLAYINACGGKNVVVSIQGLISVIADYYNLGLTKRDVYSNLTLRDVIKGNLFSQQKRLKKEGELETELLKKVKHVIGRTGWDKAHTWAINPNLEYHFCNETLREEFYTGQWCFEKCEPYSIFLSQASYPVKGAHQLFKALPLIKQHYPQVKVRIAGVHPNNNLLNRIILGSGYSRYLSKLADQLSIKELITYLGPLNAEQMKAEYLRSNVFVCPSTIENSPNSVGEAQILGVPCISSYIGGAMDLISKPSCGELYRFEDVEMLAYKVCETFEKSRSFDSTAMRELALQRHNAENNAKVLVSVYEKISEQIL